MNQLLRSCCFVFVCALANADTINKGDQSVTAMLGLAIPISNIDATDVGGGRSLAGGSGFAGGFQYLYNVSPRLGVGADFNYLHAGDATSSTLIPHGDSTVNFNSNVFLAVARLNLKTTGTVIPFVFSGLGVHSTTLHLNTAPSSGFAWIDTGTTEERPLISDTGSSVAIAFGGGADFYLSNTVFLGVEGRYDYLGSATYSATPNTTALTGVKGDSGAFGIFNFLVHVGYRFGGSNVSVKTAIVPDASPTSTSKIVSMDSLVIPQKSPSGDQEIKDFIFLHYSALMNDLNAWQGPSLNSLLDILGIPAAYKLDCVMKIKEFSQKYSDIPGFAQHVVELRKKP